MSDINEPLCPRCAGTAEVTRKRTIVSGGRGEDSAGSLSPAETVTLEHLQRMHRWGLPGDPLRGRGLFCSP